MLERREKEMGGEGRGEKDREERDEEKERAERNGLKERKRMNESTANPTESLLFISFCLLYFPIPITFVKNVLIYFKGYYFLI